MKEFIKVWGFNGNQQIVNLTDIVIVTPKESHSILTMRATDRDGKNIQIEDSIRSFETYHELLVDKPDKSILG
ncbi:MAG TPA: hypothetical protein VGN20_06450 [Mucilaginibacter sp.]|jgi:hypothetical protein